MPADRLTDAELAAAIAEFRNAPRTTRMSCLIADRNLALAQELAELRAENARLRSERNARQQTVEILRTENVNLRHGHSPFADSVHKSELDELRQRAEAAERQLAEANAAKEQAEARLRQANVELEEACDYRDAAERDKAALAEALGKVRANLILVKGVILNGPPVIKSLEIIDAALAAAQAAGGDDGETK